MATTSLLRPPSGCPPARPAARRAGAPLTVALAQPSGKAKAARRPAAGAASANATVPPSIPVPSVAAADDDQPPLDELKLMLLDSLYGCDRGLSASSEVRAEINELITQLEARCPPLEEEEEGATTSPPSRLDGAWTLAYTANSELVPLLALGRLPGCSVGPITQTIAGGTVLNSVPVSGPLVATTLEAEAAAEARSPRRLALRFERGRVAPLTPGLASAAGLDGLLPARLSILGADLDLAPLKAALAPANEAARAAGAALASAAAGLPPLDFPIGGGPLGPSLSETWLLTTYLDGGLRIARGDGGSVFVMTREEEEGQSPAARGTEMEGMFEDE